MKKTERQISRNKQKEKRVRETSWEEEVDYLVEDYEEADDVTDDTLEFLSLDDETIENYQREQEAKKKASSGRKATVIYEDEEDDEYEDEYGDDDEYEDGDDEDEEYEYEDEDYEDEEYEYEDEDYEEEDYEDEEDDEYEPETFGEKFTHFIRNISAMDALVAGLGILVLVGACVAGGLYANAKSVEKQVEAFATVGEQMQGVSVIGESGLLAVSESARLANMIEIEEEEEQEAEEQEDTKKLVEVSLNITSIQSDMKIKFVNKATGKLIGGVPFEVTVTGAKNFDLKDDDKDGVIYQTGVAAGTYNVTIKPLTGENAQDYKLPASASSVTVSDKIAYKKVDVVDEVKTEAEVNVAAEDTAVQDTVVESTLQDTVEWVESTKTPIGEAEGYTAVDKKDITDPWTVSNAFRKMVSNDEKSTVSGNDGDNTGNGNTETKTDAKATISATSVSLKKGDTTTLTVSVTPAGAAFTTTWGTSDASVATVNNGTIKAEGAGTATITAAVLVPSTDTVNGVTQEFSCTVTVTETAPNYTKVTISGTAEVTVGKTVTLTATTDPAGGKVTWSSDNDKIAKVDGSGVVTGVAEGTANIKATCADATNITATYKITVKKSAVDGTTKLKDKKGNQLYYKDGDGNYKEATYDDYKKYDTFYIKSTEASEYKYTGWQTIDGSVYFYNKDGNYVTGEQVIQGAKYNFGSDGKLSSGSGSMGIDVSKWNGSIDWNAVKNSGVSYVIIRCGYRGSSTGALIEDPKFKSNIQGAKAAGLKVGVYFFSQAVNEVEAVEEASMALSLVKGYGLNYPIFLDVESSGGRGDGIGKDTRTAVCKAFCQTVQNSGYSAGIYANKTWFSSYINTSSLTGYKIWLAQYASAPSYTATRYDMWQYSSKGKVSGISGNVDMNISYLNY